MISNKILNRIKKHGRGWVFCPKDFYDLTTRAVIDNSLSKLVSDNVVVRVERGIYYFPAYGKYIDGMMNPNPELVAKVVAKNNGMILFPGGAYSANILGLSTQVPAKIHYFSNKSLTKKIGNTIIFFKKSYLVNLKGVSEKLSFQLSALEYFGKNGIDKRIINKSAKILDEKDKKDLLKITNNLPAWLSNIVHKIILA